MNRVKPEIRLTHLRDNSSMNNKKTLSKEMQKWKSLAVLNADKLSMLHNALFTHEQSLLIQKILISNELLKDEMKMELLSKVIGLTSTIEEDHS